MKKIESKFQEPGILKVIALFNIILEESHFNLNQIVKGDSIIVSGEMSEVFLDSLKEFVDLIPNEIRHVEQEEEFWSLFENLDDYENNDKFIMWLKRYVEAFVKPNKEAMFLKEMDDVTFKKLSNYCFENLILKNISKNRIDKEIGDIKQILILRKIIFTFIEMVIVDNLSKEDAYEYMQELFCMQEGFCEVLWNQIQKNEERLWRIMLMKQYDRIENKCNQLLEVLVKEV